MPGTYVALRLEKNSAAAIRNFCERNGIVVTTPSFEDRLHVTLIYSRVHFDFTPTPGIEHIARISAFDLFSDSTGKRNVLVAKLHAPSVAFRHRQLRSTYGATHDYPIYTPHITLQYDCGDGFDLTKLRIPDFTIVLNGEYTEDLTEI